VQETQHTFEAFIDEVGNNVLELLRLFNREATALDHSPFLKLLTLLRLEAVVNTHEACNTPNILVFKGLEESEDTFGPWLRSHIQKNANLRVKLPAKTLKEPQVWRKLRSVGMLETTDDFEFVLIVWPRTPKILIDKGEVLLDWGRKVVVILNKVAHSLTLEVLDFIQNDIDSFV
jgi:hypothetical protein